MPGPIYHVHAPTLCTHGGKVSVVSSNRRVKVSGMAVATKADLCVVAGCAFTPGPKPQPCVTVKWVTPAQRVKVMGIPVVLATSVGLCQSAERIVQGPASVLGTQPRVRGT